jgi:hypothetical protein
MLKNPQVGFRDPELKLCSVEMNQLGQPKARSGNFATVYRGYRPDRSEFAIRVFNRRQDERLEHYRTISEYLEQRSISSIVSFEYDQRGIRSGGDGKYYPLLTMEWVPGITLFEWTRDRCREGYVEALQIAAEVWLHLVRELAENGVVHGDLQHGNVMVSPEGHFKLVDYDCMCVPALIGRRNLETGLPPYQHPGRNADTILFPGMDHFSALVIYVALRALAAAPHLWITYVDQQDYDRILFRDEDFRTPAASGLYRDLLQSPDEQVRDLTHYLFELTRFPLEDVPPVDEVLLWCESVENLVAACEWDKVVRLVERMGPGEHIAAEMQPFVAEARRRVECRQAIEDALEKGDEQRIEQWFNTGLLHNYPAAEHLLEPASHAAQVQSLLRILKSARHLQAWGKLKTTWLENQHLLQGRVSTRDFQCEVQKLLAVDRLRELLAASPPDCPAVLDAWQQLQQLGGHPLGEPLKAAVEALANQHRQWKSLEELMREAPASPNLAFDKKLAAAASAETVRGLDPSLTAVREYLAAQRRLKLVRRVHELEKKGTVESETFIAGVMKHLPKDYHEGLAKRALQAARRVKVYRVLEEAIASSASEREIVEAWKKLGEVRGRVLAPGEVQKRVELAVARLPLLRALKEIPRRLDVEQQRKLVQEVWNPELLDDCPAAAPWRDLYEGVRSARQMLECLVQAVAEENLDEAERLLQQPEFERMELPADVSIALHELRNKSQQIAAANRQAIVNTLLEHDRSAFVARFDADGVADICRQFRHHQPVIRQWVEADILPADRIGLAVPPDAAVTRDEDNQLHVRWMWPPANVSNECRLVISSTPPHRHSLPEDVPALHCAVLRRDQWDEQAGYVVPADPQWEGCRIFVWAVVELGFQTFFSEPFEVGTIEPTTAKPRRWGLFRGWRGEKTTEEAPSDEQEPSGETPTSVDSPEPPTDNSETSAANNSEIPNPES